MTVHTLGIVFYVIFVIFAIASIVLSGIALKNFRESLNNPTPYLHSIVDNDIRDKFDRLLIFTYIFNIILLILSAVFIAYEFTKSYGSKTLSFTILILQLIINSYMYYIYKDMIVPMNMNGLLGETNQPIHTSQKTTELALPGLIVNVLAIVMGLIAVFTI